MIIITYDFEHHVEYYFLMLLTSKKLKTDILSQVLCHFIYLLSLLLQTLLISGVNLTLYPNMQSFEPLQQLISIICQEI